MRVLLVCFIACSLMIFEFGCAADGDGAMADGDGAMADGDGAMADGDGAMADGDGLSIPDGCEDVFVASDMLQACSIAQGEQRRCEFVMAHADADMFWSFSLSDRLTERDGFDDYAREMDRRLACVDSFISQLGLQTHLLKNLHVIDIPRASFNDIEALFYFEHLFQSIVPYCPSPGSEPDFCRCEQRSSEICRDSPYCGFLMGTTIGRERNCFERDQIAGDCTMADQACGDVPTQVLDPEGNCWFFSTTCIPESFEGNGNADWCNYNSFVSQPDCNE